MAKKLEKMIYVFFAMGLLAVMLIINPLKKEELSENTILRNGYDSDEKIVRLIASSEGVEEEIEISVEPLHYSKVQLDEFAKEIFASFPEKYFFFQKKTGEGVYVIKRNLNLPEKIDGYPFELAYESSDYEIMDNRGNIILDDSQGPEEVILTVTLSCYEYTWEKEYSLLVHEVNTDWEDSFSEKTANVIEELDNNTAESEKLILPRRINGHTINYREKKDNTIYILFGFMGVVIVLLWILPDNNLSAKIEERNKQLLSDYAMLVNKLTLYMGAGLSLRSAVAKIVRSTDKNRFLAKELEIAVRELENGISEQMVMERLAERCRIPCYIKLSVLLNQNIKKGSNNLQRQLKEEVEKAFEERKILAGKYAQEAGTKLLFPMVLMLLVVMVIIMYPAFVSFTI